MSDYLSSYVIDPLTRQARRLSQISQNNLNQSLVLAESFSQWTPTRLWSGTAYVEGEEESIGDAPPENSAAWVRFWRSQNALMPSPPLDALHGDIVEEPVSLVDTTALTPLEHQNPEPTPFPATEANSQERPRRTDSEQSLNPLRHLPERSRLHEQGQRGHSTSDPISRLGHAQEMPVDGNGLDATSIHGDGSTPIPEDDGHTQLRSRIKNVWRGEGSSNEKSRRVHLLMMEKYAASQQRVMTLASLRSHSPETIYSPLTPPASSPGMTQEQSTPSLSRQHEQPNHPALLPADMERTYAPPRERRGSGDSLDEEEDDAVDYPPQMGCKHYVRNVKPQCVTCLRYYPCRLCHDEAVKDHTLPRHSTETMLCMHCLTPQPAAQYCRECGECAATYYCDTCKLWNSDPNKSIYHCDDCGICRLGEGLGKDFYHCPTCAVCISVSVAQSHRCIEKSTKCDCPICGEYMFTSLETVIFMRCGHSIHQKCFKDWCKRAYKCPICSKSVVNMETQFRRLERHIAEQPMPGEYRDAKALIYCNDCLNKSLVAFHWLGLKCDHCEGYNTTQVEFFGAPNLAGPPEPDQHGAESMVPRDEVAGEAIAEAMARRAVEVGDSQRPRTAISDIATSSTSPWLIPHRSGPRSASPGIGNYFGTERREERRPSFHMSAGDSDEELEFWGGQSPRSHESFPLGRTSEEGSEVSSDSDVSMNEEDEAEDDDDDDEIDTMDLLGHR